MDDHIRRETEMNVCERPPITQEIKGGEKSICWSCFHWEVCFAKENQPCVKCTRYIPTADVRPVVRGEWIPQTVSSGRDSWKCSVCGRRARGKKENLPFCHCGADMREEDNPELLRGETQ